MSDRKEPAFADAATIPESGSRELLYRAVIGPNECDYYASQFSRIDEKWQTAGSWNWPAFFLTFPWLIYRKMYGRALLYFMLPYLLVVSIKLYAMLFPNLFWYTGLGKTPIIVGGILYLIFLFIIVPGIANKQYHKHCMRKMKKACKRSADSEEQLAWLGKRGGTNSMFAVGLLSALGFIVVSSSVEAVRIIGQTANSVNLAYSSGLYATQMVSEYYSFHQMLPETLEETGYPPRIPKIASDVEYDSRNGVLTLPLNVRGAEGKHLVWTPSTPEFLELKWTCSSPDLPDMYVPMPCKAKPKKPLLQ